MTCNEDSNALGLCLTCNEAKGYKKVNYTIVYTDFYDCVLNTSTKISKFFYNETNKEYRPCYKTCKKCSKSGDEYANNCLECDNGYMFRPGNNPYNNCVAFSEFYYITPYNQYKALNTLQCPEESKYLVKTEDKSYCIYDCKKDEVYKYLYNGVCLKQCPSNTINKNFVCNEIEDVCTLGEVEMDDKNTITQQSTEILVRTYLSEFNYTNKHISLHTNKKYSIIIYKNRNCISELSLEMPKVDFKDCYDKVKGAYRINEDLIIVIIDKKEKNKDQTYFSFFHPLSGQKLDAEEICKDETIEVTQNLTSRLSEENENYELQTFLTEQGINIFNMDDPFYTDICFDFDNPSNRDIPLSERIKVIYPDVSLCDEGCQMDGIDLDTMTALCNCKFNDIANNNIIKENPLLDTAMGEVFDLIKASNILVMKCYDHLFDNFTGSMGGILALVSLAGHLGCTVLYFIIGKNQIRIYIYNIYEKFTSFIEKAKAGMNYAPPKRSLKNEKLRDKLIKNKKSVRFNEIKKEKKNNENSSLKIDTHSMKAGPKIRIEKPPSKDYDAKSTYKEMILYREKSAKGLDYNYKKIMNKNKKSKYLKEKVDSMTKLKTDIFLTLEKDEDYRKFFDEYLATSLDELEYDDAIIKDKRTFCEYLMECLKEKQMIAFTFISSDPLKIRIIKIMLFILNIVLYFVVIGLFYNEEYIGTLYYIDKNDEPFFGYITRSIDKFIYTTMVSIIIGYIIDCFFVDEKKIKGIFKREKDNLINLRREITDFINNLKNKYFAFIILIFILLSAAFYYLLCFNYVYPKTQIEWIKCSVTIFIIMQILSILKCFLETSLRFLSFRCESEKLYKVSRFFA